MDDRSFFMGVDSPDIGADGPATGAVTLAIKSPPFLASPDTSTPPALFSISTSSSLMLKLVVFRRSEITGDEGGRSGLSVEEVERGCGSVESMSMLGRLYWVGDGGGEGRVMMYAMLCMDI
jgi:hypothetical protein